jgi:hypothetical protein
MTNRIYVQDALLKGNKPYIRDVKERVKREFIKRVEEMPSDDMVTIEERENCYYITIDANFK